MTQPLQIIDIRHSHLFCGLGGGAKGFNRGQARVGTLVARFRCVGGIDIDPAAVRDFERLAGVPGTVLDLFSREQYLEFFGREPGPDWREAMPSDIHRGFGGERPHILFLSAPCKGFSGLLSERQSRSGKYQALNSLTLRGIWLALEAYKNDPIELIVFENVPRIATRGRYLLDQIVALLRAYGYAVAETTHDCGELGGLAQSRKRFLLVARHIEKVPTFLYEPPKRPLRGVGEILDKMPVPLTGLGGPMHRMPALHWKTWVRLAFVEAGSDWRSLNRLRVEGGALADYGIAPDVDWHGGVYGVRRWDEPSATVTGRSSPSTGAYAVADPRFEGHAYSQYGVIGWDCPAGVLTSQRSPGQGSFSIADPRIGGPARFNNCFRIVPWRESSPAVAGPGGAGGLSVADPRAPTGYQGKGEYRVTAFDEAAGANIGASTTGNGGFAVADPRPGFGPSTHHHVLKVTDWHKPGGTITASSHPAGGALSVADPRGHGFNGAFGVRGWSDPAGTVAGESLPPNGPFSVADPRPDFARDGRDAYLTAGHYGVLPYDAPAGAITGSAQHDNGRWSVADPRPTLPGQSDRLVCVIRALDGTWHRPFTTLELAALQSLVDPEEHLELDGLSDSAWRERIGNAVPPAAAEAIASVMGQTLLLAWSGQTFMLSNESIWVRPIAVALMAATPDLGLAAAE